MFIKIPVYFELTGQVTPEEVQTLTQAWQTELTKQINSEIKVWRKFNFKISERNLTLELRTASIVKRSIVSTVSQPGTK